MCRKYFVTVTPLILVLLSCDKDEPATDDSPVGTWSLTTENSQYTLTTNSDQTILNPYTEGEGGIQITGAEESTLTFLDKFAVGTGNPIIIVRNNPLSGTIYSLWIQDRLDSVLAVLSVITLSYEQSVEYYGIIDYTFDGVTLAISSGILEDEDSNSVSVSGELTGVTVSIPANTPTTFDIELIPDQNTELTLNINEDGTYSTTLQTSDGTSSGGGTWFKSGDQLTLETISDDTSYQTVFFRSVENDILTLWDDEHDACLDLYDDPYFKDTDCHEFYEGMFNLEAGSLDTITTSMYMEYERISGTTARINNGDINNLPPEFFWNSFPFQRLNHRGNPFTELP